MKIDCSKTTNYFKEKDRMTNICQIECSKCLLSKENNNRNIHCGQLQRKYPEEAVDIVQQWSDEHPQKTYKDDFFEKFPKAPKDGEGHPVCPPCHIYEVLLQNSCRNCIGCDETWDKPYKE